MDPLDSFTIKFDRAQEHALQLNRAVGNQRYSISTQANLDPEGTGDYRFVLSKPPPTPRPWHGLLGDAIHNYRASLDHLIWGLTTLDGGKTGSWTQFPVLVCDAWEEKSKWRARATLDQLRPVNREIIKELQPYNGWDGPGLHPLRRLDKLENIDKHRQLNTVFLLPVETRFTIKNDTRDFNVTNLVAVDPDQRLIPGAVIATWEGEVTGPNPHVHVECELSARIAFEDGSEVLTALAQIHNYIATEVARLLPDEVKATLSSGA